MRREKEAIRLEEERRRKKEEMKAKRYEMMRKRRARTESERWGTPERAYNTWEARTRNTVDWANGYAEKLLRESEEMRSRYAQRHFRLYRKRDFLSRLLGDKIFTGGVVSSSDFSYGEGDGHSFPVVWKGKKVILWTATLDGNCILINNYHEIEITPGIYVEDSFKLTGILDQVFKPRIAAEQIREGKNHVFDGARLFLKYGNELRTTPQETYSFSCKYDEFETVEDTETYITFNNPDADVFILNPFYEDQLEGAVMMNIYVKYASVRNTGSHWSK